MRRWREPRNVSPRGPCSSFSFLLSPHDPILLFYPFVFRHSSSRPLFLPLRFFRRISSVLLFSPLSLREGAKLRGCCFSFPRFLRLSPRSFFARLSLSILGLATRQVFLFPRLFPACCLPRLPGAFLFASQVWFDGRGSTRPWTSTLPGLPVLVSFDEYRFELAQAIKDVLAILRK